MQKLNEEKLEKEKKRTKEERAKIRKLGCVAVVVASLCRYVFLLALLYSVPFSAQGRCTAKQGQGQGQGPPIAHRSHLSTHPHPPPGPPT